MYTLVELHFLAYSKSKSGPILAAFLPFIDWGNWENTITKKSRVLFEIVLPSQLRIMSFALEVVEYPFVLIHRLTEQCWASDMNQRPSFLEIIKRLEKIKEILPAEYHWNFFSGWYNA
jgi:hypothetical protein